MKRRTFIAASTAGLTANAVFAGVPGAGSAPPHDELASALGYINQARCGDGLPLLHLNPVLQITAQYQCALIWDLIHATHFDADGRTPDKRAAANGYQGDIIGETLASSYGPFIATIDIWLRTADTRHVVMDPTATEIGLARAAGLNDQIWYGAVLGKGQSV